MTDTLKSLKIRNYVTCEWQRVDTQSTSYNKDETYILKNIFYKNIAQQSISDDYTAKDDIKDLIFLKPAYSSNCGWGELNYPCSYFYIKSNIIWYQEIKAEPSDKSIQLQTKKDVITQTCK